MLTRIKKDNCVIVSFWTVSSGLFSSIERTAIEVIKDGQSFYLGSPLSGKFVTQPEVVPSELKKRQFFLYTSPKLVSMRRQIEAVLKDANSAKLNFNYIICNILKAGEFKADLGSSCQRSNLFSLLQLLVKHEKVPALKSDIETFQQEYAAYGRNSLLKQTSTTQQVAAQPSSPQDSNTTILKQQLTDQAKALKESNEALADSMEMIKDQDETIKSLEIEMNALKSKKPTSKANDHSINSAPVPRRK